MTPAQLSMMGFIVFTIAQLSIFIACPWMYDAFEIGLDGPPYVYSRLIGTKEVGLMAIYTAATFANDESYMWATVAGRLNVILLVAYMVRRGAPWNFCLGVIQDILGASATAWLLLPGAKSEMSKRRKPRGLLPGEQQPLEFFVRLLVLLGGAGEALLGVSVFLDPPASGVVKSPYGAPLYLGFACFGFMSTLIGGYQIFIATKRASAMTYVAVGFHHLWFFWAFRSGLIAFFTHPSSKFQQERFQLTVNPSSVHLVVGSVLFPAAFYLLLTRQIYH